MPLFKRPQEADLLRRSLFFYRGLCLQKLGRHKSLYFNP